MPTISVLMPCFNAATTLDEALESLARQTFKDFEIIAVDDGSTDSTLQVLNHTTAFGERLRVICQPHAGIVAALNTGLSACQGNYVARMDSDDRCLPERLARQFEFLETNLAVDVVSCRVSTFPTEQVREGFRVYLEWINSLESNAEIWREIFVESPLPHPSVMVRKAVLDRAGGYQEHGWPEDYDLWLRLYLAGVHFARLPEILLEWREHPSRLTRTDPRYSLENFLRLKAHYLRLGPLVGRQAIFIWGAGMTGRRLSMQLVRLGIPIRAFIDIDPRKIGGSLCKIPIIAPDELPGLWRASPRPALLTAVGARHARPIIRARLQDMGLEEGVDWLCAA